MNPKPLFLNLALIGIIFLTVTGGIFLAVKTTKIDSTNPSFRQVMLEGLGKVKAEPTVSAIRIGVITQGKDIAKISKDNTEKMNGMTSAFKALGIADADLKTENYSLNPEYAYKEGKTPEIQNFAISQTLVIKVRDLSKIQEVLQKAVELGSNNVSGPEFTIDDEKNLINEGRKKALAELKEKKKMLEKNLGVDLGKISSYNEYVERAGGPYPPPYYDKGMGIGMGGGEAMETLAIPDIQAGSLEMTVHVNVSYEIE